ncbi:MAG: ribosomal protein S18-alanine N-acetyltransferase [Burkholderiales bacterium]|tara:strand:- start:270 stop:737 length:468 start_codon:yes stop_codon:yes gene_type:complete
MSNYRTDKTDVIIREMHQEDVDAVSGIEKTIYAFPWTAGNFTDCLTSGYRCHVLIRNDMLAAYGVQMPIMDEMHLLNLSVASEFQKLGIGKVLLNFLATDAVRHKASKMILEVRRTNLAAIFLYESSGFNQIGLRKNYYPASDCREDAIVMEMSL